MIFTILLIHLSKKENESFVYNQQMIFSSKSIYMIFGKSLDNLYLIKEVGQL